MAKSSIAPRPWRTRSSAIAYNRRIQVIEDLVGTPDGDEFVYIYQYNNRDEAHVVPLCLADSFYGDGPSHGSSVEAFFACFIIALRRKVMLQLARVAAGWTVFDVFHMFGTLVITRKRSRRPSAMDLAALDTWWHVCDEVL